jgi:hypothetical protein
MVPILSPDVLTQGALLLDNAQWEGNVQRNGYFKQAITKERLNIRFSFGTAIKGAKIGVWPMDSTGRLDCRRL